MPIDRRTFVLGIGVAAVGGTFPSFGAATVPARGFGPVPAVAAGPLFELRIVGWDRCDDHKNLAWGTVVDAVGWIAIDQHWRGDWH